MPTNSRIDPEDPELTKISTKISTKLPPASFGVAHNADPVRHVKHSYGMHPLSGLHIVVAKINMSPVEIRQTGCALAWRGFYSLTSC